MSNSSNAAFIPLADAPPQTFSEAEIKHRTDIRLRELDLVAAYLVAGQRVLEIGAGAGWQAKALEEQGFDVEAIDVPSSNYTSARVWPVVQYDGVRIPFPDASFDVVFSSNVLEHVPHIESFQLEILRVLRSGGRAVHLMPTSTWRTWTCLTYYPTRVRSLLTRRSRKPQSASGREAMQDKKPEGGPGKPKSKLALLFPHMHGVRGTLLSEFYYFSRAYWNGVFRRAGWDIEEVRGNSLLYSGHKLFGGRLPIGARSQLSRVLGSSCNLFVLRKPDQRTAIRG